MDVAQCSGTIVGGWIGWDWIFPNGLRYGAPYNANNYKTIQTRYCLMASMGSVGSDYKTCFRPLFTFLNKKKRYLKLAAQACPCQFSFLH